jgi:membrane protease subunit (stomatin/prohibitin family)
MAVIDLVKWDGSPSLLAWKFPSNELSTATQLIVNESQEAFLVRGGVYEGPFAGGRHTLSTENLPILRSLIGLPFGKQSPFSAEIWFVNKLINLDVKWGTADPIQLQDPKYQIMVPVRAFGQYGLKVTNSKKFLLKLVGALPGFDIATLSAYFKGAMTTKIKTEIATSIVKMGVSVLEVTTHLEDLSELLKKSIAEDIEDYGVSLVQFNIHSINVPEDDPAVISLKNALAKKAEMGIVGFTYHQERQFDVLQTAAGNEGNAGGVMGAGIGLGLGAGVGAQIGQMLTPVVEVPQTHNQAEKSSAIPASQITLAEKIQALKDLSELKDQGILTVDEFNEEKRKILSQ